MKCEYCDNEAAVHLSQIKNNKRTEMHLCADCAKARGFHNPLDDVPFPLADLLASMVQRGAGLELVGDLACEHCGMKFVEFSKFGRFGCGACYEAFRGPLGDLMRKIHGATQHRGRTPGQKPSEDDELATVVKLRDDLKKAVDREDFELAAELRDRLKSMPVKET